MKCEEFKKIFSESDAARSDQTFTTDEIEHLQTCESCSSLVNLDLELDAVIRKEFKQEEVPARVKEKLRQNMTNDAGGSLHSAIIRVAVPALAMAAMLIIFLLPHGGSFASMDHIGQLAIADHESHLGHACTKGVPVDLAAWGRETIGLAISVPVLPFAGSELIAVSKCTLGDCETAHLTYVRDGKRFSVFIFPVKEAGFSLHTDRNYTLDFEKYQVTIWKSKQQVYALVT